MCRPILYSFRRCPYAMRARMGLTAAGLNYEHREIILRNKPAAMLAISSKGTVPVFVKKNGQVIDESLEILLWALGQSDPQGWLDCDRVEADRLITANDGPFKIHLDHYKYKSRYDPDARRGDVDAGSRKKAETFLKDYETRLQKTTYLISPRQSVADIAIFPFIRQFANTDKVWWEQSPYPAVQRWLEMHVASELFIKIMTKHLIWQSAKSP